MLFRFARPLAALLCFACVPATALAQSSAHVTGTIVNAGKPVAGATIVAVGNTVTLRTTTDARGRFTLAGLPPGPYQITATSGELHGQTSALATSAGTDVAIDIAAPREIGRTSVARAPVSTRAAGTDTTLTAQSLTRGATSGGSFADALVAQVPGTARGANGVVHINGDHGDINYIVDGVTLPQSLNRVLGSEVDLRNVAFADVLEGAYPAQYGERFAAVVNIGTRPGNGPSGASFATSAGSFGTIDSDLTLHRPIGAGQAVLGLSSGRTNRALDPPSYSAPLGAGSSATQFFRYTVPTRGGSDVLSFTASHSLQTFQIPPDVDNGAPATQSDTSLADDLFAALIYRHAIGDHGALTFGPSYKRTRLRDTPDIANDWTAGFASSGAAPSDCAGDITQCPFAVYADRTVNDYQWTTDYALRSEQHDVRAGAFIGLSTIAKTYDVFIPPRNPLTNDLPAALVDNAPNNARTTGFYLQDAWRMTPAWELDYGLRADSFAIGSREFRSGFGQFSPRVKLTRFLSPRSSVYAYYGRFFTPFSLENISPSVAMQLQPQSGNFDLRPQRDSVYEIGGHLPLGRGDLGFRAMQKNAFDVIDDTQVGNTNLHQDINYANGTISIQSLAYQQAFARNGRFSISLTRGRSFVKNCETQLLAPCVQAPGTDWGPADHDQRWTGNSSLLLNDRRGGWFSAGVEYGSGLSSACDAGNCYRTPHTVLNLQKGIALNRSAVLTLGIGNALNDRYYLTYRNAQGNHIAPPRTFTLGVRFGSVDRF